MSIRTTLLQQLNQPLNFGGVVSNDYNVEVNEIPWNASGEPLYRKNLGVVYLDEEEISKTQLYRTLDQGDVFQTDTLVTAYMSEDAKNIKAENPTVVTNLINVLGVINTFNGFNVQESNLVQEQEVDGDVITYTFEYTFTTI
tara:strand:- start:6876 stop:7301 length:426 start_codon:yes stop_codon:yes gene_type:complete